MGSRSIARMSASKTLKLGLAKLGEGELFGLMTEKVTI
jgi:hypothetical protein